MDQEMRDALRKFVVAMAGEEEIVRLMNKEDSYTDNWGHILPAGEKTREEAIDFLVGLSKGIQRFFEEWHAQHGTYPEPLDHSKLSPSLRLLTTAGTYCEACRVKRGWPEALGASFGGMMIARCEVCGKETECHVK